MKFVIIDHSRFREAVIWCSTNISKNFDTSGLNIEYTEDDWAVAPMDKKHRLTFKNDKDAFRFLMEVV